MNTMAQVQGQRFLIFMEDEGFNQYTIAPVIEKPQSTVNKYIKGNLRVPGDVLELMHLKLHLNIHWFFTGKGNKKVKGVEKKTLVTDVSDLKIELNLVQNKLMQYVEYTDKLVRDFYAAKHNS